MSTPADRAYAEGFSRVENGGTAKSGRAHPTVSATAVQLRFHLREGFPLLEHKRVPFRHVHTELAWFLGGHTHVGWLQDRKVTIWNDDAAKAGERGFGYPEGELGPVYGEQWRRWGPTDLDQIRRLIDGIKANPLSRRHVVSAWNPTDVDKMVLPPCHLLWQVLVDDDGAMDLALTMRSGDYGLGVPFNIASYALLLELIARETGHTARTLTVTINDCHLYLDHIEPLAARLLEAAEVPVVERMAYPLPALVLPETIRTIDDFVAAHEADRSFRLEVAHYAGGEPLRLPLHT